ncbi:glycerophosphodiester phosphodiesterase [Carnobacteriaceae bacterium zg-84]|uniref:glycerophosphodiester phosphodiesterase n=1 Tax=Granulicatella sp. zg-84 TaxID=2678503 RepID=UPI0013C16899|nr:glycerophosphodiester phosphodiesterase [Granulicatella sp. zg-84]NEW66139.1 hypothetical protein [Granulicatella sp. zg-84]QMI86104.1 glycerophosphodiester phosphodiesterase [Carnobacteriaceae bacterium zg-84]
MVIKETYRLMTKNKCEFLNIILFTQFMILFGSFSIMKYCLKWLLVFVGTKSLTLDSIPNILFSPMAWLLLIVILLIATISIYFELSTIMLGIMAYKHQKSLSLRAIFHHTIKNLKEDISPQFIWLLLYFVSAIPITQLGYHSFLLNKLSVPTFISLELQKYFFFMLLYIVFLLVSIYIHIRLIYALPLLVLSRFTIKQSFVKSWALTKAKGSFVVVPYLWIWGVFQIGQHSVAFLSEKSILLLGHEMTFIKLMMSSTILALSILIICFLHFSLKICISVLLVDVLFKKELVTDTYYLDKQYKQYSIMHWIKYFGLSSIICFIYGITCVYMFFYQFEDKTVVIAHRGDSVHAVENSVEALENAAKQSADYVEIDIRLTKDNRFIVSHDNNIKRLSKLNKKISDSLFDEIHGVSVTDGIHVSSLVSLEEYIEKAKQLGIKLIVEIKPHGKEKSDYLALLANIFKRYDVEKDYIVQSLDKEIIETFQQKAPNMKVGYIVPFQFGGIPDTTVDFLVVEESSYNHHVQDLAHFSSKKMFVWTVNTKKEIRRHLFEQTDGIITDKLDLVHQTKNELSDNHSLIQRYKNVSQYLFVQLVK